MPGELKTRARCPRCSRSLIAIVDTTSSDGVTREYFHRKPFRERRPRRCIFRFDDFAEAQIERRKLEVR
jgi:hypothetical protein